MSRWCHARQLRDQWTEDRPWVVQFATWAYRGAKPDPDVVWWMLDFPREVLRRACEEEAVLVWEEDAVNPPRSLRAQKRATSMTLDEALRLFPIVDAEFDTLKPLRLLNLKTNQIMILQRRA